MLGNLRVMNLELFGAQWFSYNQQLDGHERHCFIRL